MGDVVELDNYRPHIMIVGISGNAHVIPESFFINVISGEQKIAALEHLDDLMPVIIHQWLERLKEDKDAWIY